jgi:O-antigen/teichoic acid export membrane protein
MGEAMSGRRKNMRFDRQTEVVRCAGQSGVRQNAGWMLLGQCGKLLVQAIYFVLMARNLGPQQYGSFVGVTAMTAIIVPFVGAGAGNLMIKNVARNPKLLPQWIGNALLLTAISGTLFFLLLVPACRIALPAIPLSIVALIAVSDALLYRFVDIAGWAFQAVERLGWMANLNLFASLTRLLGIAGVVLLKRPTLLAWSTAYLATTLLCAVVAMACVIHQFDWPDFTRFRDIRRELREGLYFSASQSAQTIYNDIDKTMLARMATLDAAGIYAAAYRLIDVAFIPVRSILYAAYPGFFRSGERGVAGTAKYACRLLPAPAAYSAVTALALLVAAPVVPRALGHEYARSAEALRWLAALPLMKTLHYFAADSLTGAGYQGLRAAMQASVAIFNVFVNLWLIPAYSWRGAAWSSLASDGLLALSLWSCVRLLKQRTDPGLAVAPAMAVSAVPSPAASAK